MIELIILIGVSLIVSGVYSAFTIGSKQWAKPQLFTGVAILILLAIVLNG